MIEKYTLKYINELQEEGKTVFYNGTGYPDFFRNNVKHLSYSTTMGLTKKIGEDEKGHIILITIDDIYLIYQHTQKVECIEQGFNIKLISIESLE